MNPIEEARLKAAETKAFVLGQNDKFEGAIDPWLVQWAKVRYSGWLACGFGMALLVIGGLVGKVLF